MAAFMKYMNRMIPLIDRRSDRSIRGIASSMMTCPTSGAARVSTCAASAVEMRSASDVPAPGISRTVLRSDEPREVMPLEKSIPGVSSSATPENRLPNSEIENVRGPVAGSLIHALPPATRLSTTKCLSSQCKIAGVFSLWRFTGSSRIALQANPRLPAMSMMALRLVPLMDVEKRRLISGRRIFIPWAFATIARQARPHSAASA